MKWLHYCHQTESEEIHQQSFAAQIFKSLLKWVRHESQIQFNNMAALTRISFLWTIFFLTEWIFRMARVEIDFCQQEVFWMIDNNLEVGIVGSIAWLMLIAHSSNKIKTPGTGSETLLSKWGGGE